MPGHAGRFVAGDLIGKRRVRRATGPCAPLRGLDGPERGHARRAHHRPPWACKDLVLTNAAGGMRSEWEAGHAHAYHRPHQHAGAHAARRRPGRLRPPLRCGAGRGARAGGRVGGRGARARRLRRTPRPELRDARGGAHAARVPQRRPAHRGDGALRRDRRIGGGGSGRLCLRHDKTGGRLHRRASVAGGQEDGPCRRHRRRRQGRLRVKETGP